VETQLAALELAEIEGDLEPTTDHPAEVPDPSVRLASYRQQAIELQERKMFAEAAAVYQECERLCRELKNTDNLWRALIGHAALLEAHLNNPQVALQCMEECVGILEQLGTQPEVLEKARPILESMRNKRPQEREAGRGPGGRDLVTLGG
jgi:hypothetical protein